MIITTDAPNLSIIVPGGCNAKCKFCFWKQEKQCDDYLSFLRRTLDSVPEEFQQISLTGGEPTISPMLPKILDLIDKKRFPKVVLTTNGFNLIDTVYHHVRVMNKVDHINISRHRVYDRENDEVFQSQSLTEDELKEAIRAVHLHTMADVCLNCVISPDYNLHVIEYLKFARLVQADSVAFRVEHGSLEPCLLENAFEGYPTLYKGECPVCRTHTQRIYGMRVSWKYSVKEPSIDSNGVYELVVHPSGKVSSDWAGKEIIDMSNNASKIAELKAALEKISKELAELEKAEDKKEIKPLDGYVGNFSQLHPHGAYGSGGCHYGFGHC